MFFKCLDCGAVGLDANINIYECPFCGSESLTVVDDGSTGDRAGAARVRETARREPKRRSGQARVQRVKGPSRFLHSLR